MNNIGSGLSSLNVVYTFDFYCLTMIEKGYFCAEGEKLHDGLSFH